MNKRLNEFLGVLIIFVIIFSSFSISATSFEKSSAIDMSSLKFKEELQMPIDTSVEIAKYQPVDMCVNFKNSCWAISETENSVRIGYELNGDITEIESQIYDLEFEDDEHISSCCIVFLIPEESTGAEKYYVFYDSVQTEPANYEKHIFIEDTHYFYEPISGQIIDFDYYGVFQSDEIIYGIVQKGELLGYPVAQNIGKFKPGSKIAETYNIDQLANLDLSYGIKEEPDYYGTTWAEEVDKSILVDGNLMARMRIACYTPDGTIKTDNIYTYYYCPKDVKKIYVNCNHEVLEDINIPDPEFYVGTYAGIVSVKARSATIDKINVGEILPELTVYSEDESIRNYDIPQNPDSIKKEGILTTESDIDLGSKAWVCLSNPSTGKTHGLIMDKTSGIYPEEDGVQVKAFVKENLKLPGLEADTGNLFLMRNSYEKDYCEDNFLKKGFKVNFNVEFISLEDNGIETVDSESDVFPKLFKDLDFIGREEPKDQEPEEEKYQLTTTIHFAPSVPLGTLLSAALGKNISYIYAELYKENNLKSSGSAGRISLSSVEFDTEGKNVFQLVKSAVSLFDWKNMTLFKKITFPDLEAGNYLVKIYRENPIFAKERQYIGFQIVNVSEDASTRVFCRIQGSSDLSIVDQENDGIQNVRFYLKKDDVIVSESFSCEDGTSVITAPVYPLKPYSLNAIYKGFLIDESQVRFGIKNRLKPVKNNFQIDLFDIELNVKDTWGFEPTVDINPTVTSEEMIDPITLKSEKQSFSKYLFDNLYPAEYILKTSYKSFLKEEIFTLDKDKSIELIFPAEFDVQVFLTNMYGINLTDAELYLQRNGKKEKTSLKDNGALFTVPPGEYELTAESDDKVILKQLVNVKGKKTVDLLTNKESTEHTFIFFMGLLILLACGIYTVYKKNAYIGLKIFVIGLILMSIVSPFWVLNGEKDLISTSTKTMIYPAKIVTFTSAEDSMAGQVSLVPDEVTMVLGLILILLVLAAFFTILSIFTKKKFNKTTVFLSVISIILLLFAILVFSYAMSMVTEVGVGSFMGSGELDTQIPGISESITVMCNWGPGIGFYLSIMSLLFLIFASFIGRNKIVKKTVGKGDHKISYEKRPYTKYRQNITYVTQEGLRNRSTHTMLELDVTKAKKKIKTIKQNHKKDISFTGWIVKCIAQAITEHKQFNAYRHGRRNVIYFDHVDVAILVERKVEGEYRPRVFILRKADEKSIYEISKEIRAAKTQKITKDSQLLNPKLTLGEKIVVKSPSFVLKLVLMFGRYNGVLKQRYMGTTAVTAIGMLGKFPGGVVPMGTIGNSLIVLGGITKKPGVVNDKIKVREYLHITISSDHDLVDGGPLVRFVERLTELVEKASFLDES